MKDILVFGASGHGRVILDLLEKEGKYNVLGFIDSHRPVGETVYGQRVLGHQDDVAALLRSEQVYGGIVAIGDNYTRWQMYERIKAIAPEFKFVAAVHPSANIAREASIGEGSVVMAGATVGPCSVIKRFCILNTNASLDHDSVMEDFSSLAPNVSTGGNVTIGKFSVICIGANVSNGKKIGEHTVIGAGATVLHDIDSFKVAYGTPAKVVRERNPWDSYLHH